VLLSYSRSKNKPCKKPALLGLFSTVKTEATYFSETSVDFQRTSRKQKLFKCISNFMANLAGGIVAKPEGLHSVLNGILMMSFSFSLESCYDFAVCPYYVLLIFVLLSCEGNVYFSCVCYNGILI
jgi:hypothetical protein